MVKFIILELRKKLIKKGYFFKTNSDTEVILKGYLEWGKKFQDARGNVCIRNF